MSLSGLSYQGEHKGPVKRESHAFTCLHGRSPLGRDARRTKILLVGRVGALGCCAPDTEMKVQIQWGRLGYHGMPAGKQNST